MRKIISFVLAVSMIFCIGCSATAENAEFPEIYLIEVEKTASSINLTFPASMVENMDVDDLKAKDGIVDAVVNDDESVTIKMTEAAYQQMMLDYAASMDESFSEFIEGEKTPYIKEIIRNDDFSSIQIKVDRDAYASAFGLTHLTFIMYAFIYQSFLPDMEYHVELSFIDYQTGEIIESNIYPDDFSE